MLEDQVRDSLRMTMQPKTAAGEGSVAALTAFLRTLKTAPVAAWQARDESAIARGQRIFQARGCANCHAPPIYTNLHTYDVGLDDGEGGNRQFSPPSLRGVAHLDAYFHDGRARSLEEVLGRYQHRLRTALSDDELADLVAFSKSL
jgi:cytochrome c peroxidase